MIMDMSLKRSSLTTLLSVPHPTHVVATGLLFDQGKAMIYDYSLEEGLPHTVLTRHPTQFVIATLYWTIFWVPAQSIPFSVIPDHLLRVAFIASSASFFGLLGFRPCLPRAIKAI
jgi:hypothetical protein